MATNNMVKTRKIAGIIFNEVLMVRILSILIGLLVGGVILVISGFDPMKAYATMFKGVFSKPKYIAQTIVYAVPFIFSGLSVAFAFRTGLFNIGAEGQYIIGATTAAVLGYVLKLPMMIHIPVVLIGGALAGGLYGALAGFFKARFGVHEVISTIMLNWIMFYIANFIVTIPFLKAPGPNSTYDIEPTARISFTWLKWLVGSGVKTNYGLLIGIVAVIFVAYYLFHTVQGYELRAVGFNKEAARYAGINVDRCIVKSMFISGALSGLAGTVQVMGVTYHISNLAVMEGYGFNGIAVALIGNNTPIGVFLSAILFAVLNYGGGKMQGLGIPGEIISIVIGAIIFFIAIAELFKALIKPLKKITAEEEAS